MLATVRSAALLGIQGCPVVVEVHVASGLPGFTIVGLPDSSCREARDRARAAITSSGYSWPRQRITVNLAPSGFRKEGPGLDLAIALGILAASDQLSRTSLKGLAAVGELGLDGSLRPVPGTLPIVATLQTEAVVVPAGSYAEAALVEGISIRPAQYLRDVVEALLGAQPWPDPPPPAVAADPPVEIDLALVRGQPRAVLATEVAAAGGHHLLLVGPPGAGKTLLARALVGLLPRLTGPMALETTTIHSAAGLRLPPAGLVTRPPFRAPHHTASMISLVGGGTGAIRPGEISTSHGGVLFLDELAEFAPSTLDALRQPLEEGAVRVARAARSVTFPARFLLVGAMNPCPCGQWGLGSRCQCGDAAVLRYQRRISGPLLDRFDLRIHVGRPEAEALLGGSAGPSTAEVADRVQAVRATATARGHGLNGAIPANAIDDVAPLTPDARELLLAALRRQQLSARGVHRVRCVARTVADLADHAGPEITARHLRVALALRDGMSGPTPREVFDAA